MLRACSHSIWGSVIFNWYRFFFHAMYINHNFPPSISPRFSSSSLFLRYTLPSLLEQESRRQKSSISEQKAISQDKSPQADVGQDNLTEEKKQRLCKRVKNAHGSPMNTASSHSQHICREPGAVIQASCLQLLCLWAYIHGFKGFTKLKSRVPNETSNLDSSSK